MSGKCQCLSQGTGTTRARLHNTGGGTCHLLPGKMVFSLVFLLGMPACSALSDPCGRVTVSAWDFALTGDSLFHLAKPISVDFLNLHIFYLLPSGHSSPFHCCHVKG